jgi:hypothetical protein
MYAWDFQVVSLFQTFRLKFCIPTFISVLHATYFDHLILLDLITINIWRKLRTMKFSIMKFCVRWMMMIIIKKMLQILCRFLVSRPVVFNLSSLMSPWTHIPYSVVPLIIFPIIAIFSRKHLTALNWFRCIIVSVKLMIWREPSKLKTHFNSNKSGKIKMFKFLWYTWKVSTAPLLGTAVLDICTVSRVACHLESANSNMVTGTGSLLLLHSMD